MRKYLTWTLRSASVLLGALGLHGCAGLTSAVQDSGPVTDGVAYYMPLRVFVLTVTRTGRTLTAAWSESPTLADHRKTYVLRYNAHWIGKTTTKVGVTTAGLLTTANTNTTSSVAELQEFLTKSTTKAGFMTNQADPCASDGTYVFAVWPSPLAQTYCGGAVNVSLTPITGIGNGPVDPSTVVVPPTPAASAAITDAYSTSREAGIYYKVQRYFFASASTVGGTSETKILSAPNTSPVMMLPYGRTLFAANDGKIAFDDGMLKTYDQANDGELVALLSFPAAILSAYFKAIGDVFTAFATKDADEQKLLLQKYKLELFAKQLAECKAIQDTDPKKWKDLGCDKLALPTN